MIRGLPGAVFLALLAGLSLAAGNWDNRPVGHRTFVEGLAVDPGSHPGQLAYTFDLPNLAALGGGSSSGGGGHSGGGGRAALDPVIEAPNLVQAMSDMQRRMPREIYFGQLQALILAERLPASAVEDAVDTLMANPEVDGTAYVATAKDGRALLTAPAPSERLPSDALGLVLSCAGCEPLYDPVQLWQVYGNLRSRLGSLVLPEVAPGPDGSGLAGLAMYRGAQFASSLEGNDALAYGLLRGFTRRSNLVVPVSGLGVATVDWLSGHGTYRVRAERGRLHVDVRVRVKGQLTALQAAPGARVMALALASRDPRLLSATSRLVLSKLETIVRKQAGQGVDVLQLGAAASGADPTAFAGIRSWPEAMRTAQYRLSVNLGLLHATPAA